MRDIEKAVDEWLRSQEGARCLRERGEENLDELKDHLLCEIERLQGEGMSAESAFEAAKQRLDIDSAVDDEQKAARRQVFVMRAIIFAWVAVGAGVLLLVPGDHPPGDRSPVIMMMLLFVAAVFSLVAIRRGVSGAACARIASPGNPGGSGPRRRRHLLLANGLLWAGVMIASALVLSTAQVPKQTGSYLLLVVLVPAWFASDRVIRRALAARQ